MSGVPEEKAEPIAVVGMACRYPDAEDPAQLWEIALEGRRTFRRLPRERLDPDDYWDRNPAAVDRTYSAYAAVLDGWEFDRARFRVPADVYRAADPAHWLALETADKALADAGRPGGAGLDRDRVAVLVGNTLTGEITRARTLRLRWPYVRRVLSSALAEEGVPDEQLRAILDRTAARYLAPFPEVNDETLAGSLSNTIAGRICNHFDFGAGGYTVDGACASSLLALITACRALRDRSADFALAGGVDLSLDPFELIGFAKAGALATERMRVYDEHSAGFWPGEGCGMVALMRAADAYAAGLPVRAEIAGWGVSSDGSGGITRPERAGQLLALRRAYASGELDPSRVLLHEGHGTGTAVGDETELTALAELRRGAPRPAVLGSIKANIGHTKAAAGVASLIKTVCSLESGVLPPATGCEQPHPALRAAADVLTAPARPHPWPDGTRMAGVSAMGFGGINTHVVLRGAAGARRDVVEVHTRSPSVEVVPLTGRDTEELRATVDRLAELGSRLSQAELHDLACRFGRERSGPGPRVALVAGSPVELASRAETASGLLANLPEPGLVSAGGVFASGRVRGRVSLLFPGQGAPVRVRGEGTEIAQPAIHRESLAALIWLERLGVRAFAALGHSLGEYAALVWAGCLSAGDAEWLVRERGRLMGRAATAGTGMPETGMLSVTADAAQARELCRGTALVVAAFNGPHSHVLAGPSPELLTVAERAGAAGLQAAILPVSHAFHSPIVAGCVPEFRTLLRRAAFSPPERHIVSTVTGRPISASDDLVELLCRQITEPVRFADALGEVAEVTDLFCEVGPGRTLASLVQQGYDVPVTGVDPHGADRTLAEAAAALFAARAAPDLSPLFTARAARPIDIRRDPVFLVNPCSAVPGTPHRESPAPAPEEPSGAAADPAGVVRELVANMTELDPALITPELRLLGDLHLTSLRVVQLVAAAADLAGRGRPSAPLSVGEATVADLIDVVEQLPPVDLADADPAPQGVAPWVRCFAETLRLAGPSAVPVPRAPYGPGRRRGQYIVDGHPLSGPAARIFGSGHDYPLLYVPDPAAPGVSGVVLAAARAAIDAGGLIAVAHDAALRGFLRSLRHEHPELGVTLLRVPPSVEELRAAVPHAVAAPGEWRERVLKGGQDYEPVERLVELGQGNVPGIGVDDVLLVSGGKGIGFACAAALAGVSGVRLAFLGRSDPATDSDLRDNLHRLRDAGATVAYHRADVTDAPAVASAVRRLEQQLGPITGVLHAGGTNEPARVDQLDENRIRAHLAPKVTGLGNLLAAVDTDRLRMLVSFGSVIGTWGLQGESHYALANGALRAEMQRLHSALPGCRVLNVDWSVWTGTGMGERLGVLDTLSRLDVTTISVAEGTEIFLRLLAASGLPASVAVHGRLGGMDGSDTGESADGRFLERVRIHHPEVELVAEATLDLATDEYLSDHRIDGVVVLPAVLGLEAMAQIVDRLVGHPVREVVDLRLERPIVVPDEGARTIRVCALRRGDTVETVVRSDESGFRVDHFRASFPLGERPEPVPLEPPVARVGRVVEGDELYGPVYFHTGRFRRVREFVPLGARGCQVRVLAKEDDPWFSAEPLLGSPAVNDATVHALQACVPHRRLLPVRCERVSFSPGTDSELHISAVERHASGGEHVWDVVAYGAGGAPVITWHGLTLVDAGPLTSADAWPVPLLAVHLERAVTTVGLDPRLRVEVDTEVEGETAATSVDARSVARAAGLAFSVAGGARTACAARSVTGGGRDEWRHLLDEHAGLAEEMRVRCPEPDDVRATRVRTVVECLSKARGTVRPLAVHSVFDGGWIVVRCGTARIASTVVPVPGTGRPVAIAILSAMEERH